MKKKHQRELTNLVKNKISLFYKICFSLLVIALTVLFYFVVIVSTEPKSFPFVTKKIQEVITNNFGSESSIDQSYVTFTRYGTLKIAATDIKIFYVADLGKDKKTFLIPRLEAEFSLFDLLLFNFQPNKLRLISPNIVLSDLAKFKPQQSEEQKQSQIAILLDFLANFQERNQVEFLEIEEALLTLQTTDFIQKILLKKSQIHLQEKRGVLNISAQNLVSFDPNKNDVNFSFSCQLAKDKNPRCDTYLTHFSPDSISSLHPSLKDLGKIIAFFDISASASLSKGSLDNVTFNLKSDNGSFYFSQLFPNAIDFKNLLLAGSYDCNSKQLNVSEVSADFARDKRVISPHLAATLNISDFMGEQEKYDVTIALNDFLGDDLAKFWPLTLNQNDIRSWVIEHINSGLINNAKTQFSLSKKNGEINLDKLSADLNFTGLHLQYDKTFPAISNIAGTASFSEKGMKFDIAQADVLQSKIHDTQVAIDDFNAAKIMLKITGKMKGAAADTLKHAANDKEFHASLDKYLKGNAQSAVEIWLPLTDAMDLRNMYIAVNSTFDHLTGDFVNGNAAISTKKDFKSVGFVTSADLSQAEISLKALDIDKKINVESRLDLNVLVNQSNIQLKNILLQAKEINPQKTDEIKIAKISGNATIKTAPFLLAALNLKDQNFGKNDFTFSYRQENKNTPKIISLNGNNLNLGAFLENKLPEFSTKKGAVSEVRLQIALGKVDLLKGKVLRNYSMLLNCKEICTSGAMRTIYGNKGVTNLLITKQPKNDYSTIEGRISELGYLIEAFGISNLVTGGDYEVKIENKLQKNKMIFEGEAKLKDKMVVFESAAVKRLYKNTLLSEMKDKIFSLEKVIFDTVKVEFLYDGDIINIKTLIANNYKIGFTAKGTINLKNDTYQLKGMIIPGFIINNLFGLGNIPIIGNILTGGQGGGLFGLSYEYVKGKGDAEGKFTTNKVAAFVPSTIQNLFDF